MTNTGPTLDCRAALRNFVAAGTKHVDSWGPRGSIPMPSQPVSMTGYRA